MKWHQIIKTAAKSLKINKSRSALTILGIVIGITAIMMIVSLGKGAQGLVLNTIQGLGSNTIIIVPGKEPQGPTDPSAAESLYSDSLKERELESLENRSNVPDAKDVMPIVFGVETASYEGETFRPMILGASEIIIDMFKFYPCEGTIFTKEDVDSNAKVAIIGSKVKDEFFGQSDAVGQKIKIKDQNIKVIGVMPPKGQVLFFNADEGILMPHTTAQKYIFGIKYFNRIILRTETEEQVPGALADVKRTLRDLHNITNPDNDDFFATTQGEITEILNTVMSALTFFLAAVAAISLVVGGVGIMNIMLVSVAERTREIGLRKALGATEKNILSQFLVEAVAITGAGGIIGIMLGALFSFLISFALSYFMDLNWAFVFPFSGAIIGFFVSALIGLVFGIHPARQASKKSPMEALRYE